MRSGLYDLSILLSQSAHSSFSEWGRLEWLKNIIDNMRKISNNIFLCTLPNIYISTPWSTRTIIHVTTKTVLYIFVFESIFRDKIWFFYLKRHMFSDPYLDLYVTCCFGYIIVLYIFSTHMCRLSTFLEDRKVLEYTVSWFLS